ncbi:NERD domain-containing protein [Microbacterium sp. VKM Ac-2870]|uniref:nuclease-related domain-containing protein n=1 Tax=Microbacterium sp. VKM Ac-2870 TaxID=2783825 RepID=UPI00188A8DC9|nr:NERD domain-containing protein [Microbacterium sp. VKM Ac-2870]
MSSAPLFQQPAGLGADAAAEFGSIAAASVMSECLRLQAEGMPRSSFARGIGRSPLSEDSRSWYLGTLGELDVATRLAALEDDSWTVLHSVPVGTRGSDIDHVIVSAAGVFTVNTKFHERARVWVGGSAPTRERLEDRLPPEHPLRGDENAQSVVRRLWHGRPCARRDRHRRRQGNQDS